MKTNPVNELIEIRKKFIKLKRPPFESGTNWNFILNELEILIGYWQDEENNKRNC